MKGRQEGGRQTESSIESGSKAMGAAPARPAPLRIAPPPPRVRQNPRPGVRRDPDAKPCNSPHAFRTTGLARLWRKGKPSGWFSFPAEEPS